MPLTGDDVAVLNVVRMGDEPKRLSEIGQLLNRVDVPNLQYATRKLVRAGLIETEGSSSRKETRYRATATGHSVTEAYAALRAATLPPMLDALDGWAAKSETTRRPARSDLEPLCAGGAGRDHPAASALKSPTHVRGDRPGGCPWSVIFDRPRIGASSDRRNRARTRHRQTSSVFRLEWHNKC